MKRIRKLLTVLLVGYLLLVALFAFFQRKLLFFPSHHNYDNGLTPWKTEGKIIGYSRSVPAPKNVWLMLHGNGGQAADRACAIPSFAGHDSVFIMEYPGYGARKGKPSRASFDTAAAEAYLLLRKTFPKTPICVMAESIGSGPACALAMQSPPPDKIVLVVPFDQLASVASDHFPFLPVRLILEANWDNVRSLSIYKGPVEIFGVLQDEVIGIQHARKLADSLPSAKFHRIEGGHNDWSEAGRVQIRNP